jgi:hypothetical protein
MRELRTLELPTSRITGRGASALLTSRHLQKLTILDLSQNPVRQFDRKAIARARPSSLRVLHLENSRKFVADLTALAG